MAPSVGPDQEVSRPSRSFPNLQDLGKEIREVLAEVELLPEETETVIERKKAYRVKAVPEVKAPLPETMEQPVRRRVLREEATLSADDKNLIYHPQLSISPQAVVQGIIMSEILQPPRAKRPLRHEFHI